MSRFHPLSTMLNSTEYKCNIKANRSITHKIFYLIYLDDLKLYAESKKRTNDSLKITDNHMGFGLLEVEK